MSGDSRKATAASMSAVQDAMRQQQQEAPAGLMWPWRCPLFDESFPLVVYVLTVLAGYFTFTGFEVVGTAVTAGDITLFTGLMCCGALCVEATRRLGQPSGVWRDLLSAWWLPVALLLPPVYALIAPAVLGLLIYVRVRRGAVYRRVFSTAALGLAGACASALFRWVAPAVAQAQAADWLTYPGPKAWLMRPQQAALALACAVVFIVVNTCLIAIAAWLADPDARLADMLWDRERMLLDLTETCVGILVTIACALSAILLLVALPPVILLQRSLLHSQLKAQARTADGSEDRGAERGRLAGRGRPRDRPGAAPPRAACAAAGRRRSLQAGERHPRPPDRRRRPADAGHRDARAGPRVRPGGPVRRRGVRHPAHRHRRGRGVPGRRADPPRR